jgi:hypothetical protein
MDNNMHFIPFHAIFDVFETLLFKLGNQSAGLQSRHPVRGGESVGPRPRNQHVLAFLHHEARDADCMFDVSQASDSACSKKGGCRIQISLKFILMRTSIQIASFHHECVHFHVSVQVQYTASSCTQIILFKLGAIKMSLFFK